MRLCLASFALALSFVCPNALATDYYVHLGVGNDAGAGTIVDPWRTLTHAMATVPIALRDDGHSARVATAVVTASGGGWNEEACAIAALICRTLKPASAPTRTTAPPSSTTIRFVM